MNLYQHAKNQFTPSVHFSDAINFKVSSHDWPHPFLTMATPKTFNLICMKLYQHAKNKLIPLDNSILESSNQIGHTNILQMRMFPTIRLAKRILVYISGIKFLPNTGFLQEHSK